MASELDLLVRLKFKNRTSGVHHELITKRSTCKLINEWYASHHAGDDFTVSIDGNKKATDQDGVILR